MTVRDRQPDVTTKVNSGSYVSLAQVHRGPSEPPAAPRDPLSKLDEIHTSHVTTQRYVIVIYTHRALTAHNTILLFNQSCL